MQIPIQQFCIHMSSSCIKSPNTPKMTDELCFSYPSFYQIKSMKSNICVYIYIYTWRIFFREFFGEVSPLVVLVVLGVSSHFPASKCSQLHPAHQDQEWRRSFLFWHLVCSWRSCGTGFGKAPNISTYTALKQQLHEPIGKLDLLFQ